MAPLSEYECRVIDAVSREIERKLVKPEQKPSIGRIIHYTNLGDKDGKYPPEIQAALITKVNVDGSVALKVFYPTGIFDMSSVMFTNEPAGSNDARGRWTWPERV